MNSLVLFELVFLILTVINGQISIQEGGKAYLLELLPKRMKVCDNIIVKDIEGGAATVLAAGKRYVEWMRNHTMGIITLDSFSGQWKYEMARLSVPQVPQCTHMHVFGDEVKNYDEAKRFCYFTDIKPPGQCVAYSIGSNNNWDFEEYMHKDSDCKIETFDCTLNATIPEPIRDRTRFHPICIGATDSIDEKRQRFATVSNLNKAAGRNEGPDYFKIDVEGYEWTILKQMVKHADVNPDGHLHLPLQIYAEYHLDRESSTDNRYFVNGPNTAMVGKRLIHFWNEMFIKGGYMIMHVRNTIQTRNHDVLLAKVFCPLSE